MGLDMYLDKRTYVMNWEYMNSEERHEITIKLGGVPRTDIKPERIKYIVEQVAYWRKANQIHGWFVENVQGGEDDCGHYYVYSQQLVELLEKCKSVLADHSIAEEILPTSSGFFFGSTEYGDDYFADLLETVEMLEQILSENNDDSTFMYHSSW